MLLFFLHPEHVTCTEGFLGGGGMHSHDKNPLIVAILFLF